MKAKMFLTPGGSESFYKIFDWDDLIETNNGPVLVSEISLYEDMPIIDGVECRIIHMLSANEFTA